MQPASLRHKHRHGPRRATMAEKTSSKKQEAIDNVYSKLYEAFLDIEQSRDVALIGFGKFVDQIVCQVLKESAGSRDPDRLLPSSYGITQTMINDLLTTSANFLLSCQKLASIKNGESESAQFSLTVRSARLDNSSDRKRPAARASATPAARAKRPAPPRKPDESDEDEGHRGRRKASNSKAPSGPGKTRRVDDDSSSSGERSDNSDDDETDVAKRQRVVAEIAREIDELKERLSATKAKLARNVSNQDIVYNKNREAQRKESDLDIRDPEYINKSKPIIKEKDTTREQYAGLRAEEIKIRREISSIQEQLKSAKQRKRDASQSN